MIDFEIGNSKTKADYAGTAHIYFDPKDYDTIQAKTADGTISEAAASAFDSSMDYTVTSALWIESIGFELADKSQITEYFGDTFSTIYFGREPTILMCSGHLSALSGSNTKRNFMALYRDVLRLRKVARTGIVPIIEFTGMVARGAFIDLQLERNSQTDDLYTMSFKFLVAQLMMLNASNTSGITTLDIRFSAVN